MGLFIAVEDEQGERFETLEDPKNVLRTLFPPTENRAFRCLGFVDPYGNTTFNRSQAAEILLELDVLASREGNHEASALLDGLRRMAMRVSIEPHFYLVCYGE